MRNCGCKSIKLQTNYCINNRENSLQINSSIEGPIIEDDATFLHMCTAVYHMTLIMKRSFQTMRSMIQEFKNELRISPVIKTVALIEVDWSRFASQNLVGWLLIVLLLIKYHPRTDSQSDQQWSHTPMCARSSEILGIVGRSSNRGK